MQSFGGIEAYLRRIKTSPRAVHAGSTPVASKRTNSDGSGVVPQQLIPPGALGHFSFGYAHGRRGCFGWSEKENDF